MFNILGASPIRVVIPHFYKFIKRRKLPIFNVLGKSVLDRIVMNVVKMRIQIAFVANRVFVITALPNAIFLLFELA